MKERINKLDFLKIKHVCSAKDTVKIMKRQGTDWETIFANDKFNLKENYYSKRTKNLIFIQKSSKC